MVGGSPRLNASAPSPLKPPPMYYTPPPCGCGGCGRVECLRGCGYPAPAPLCVWMWVPCAHASRTHTTHTIHTMHTRTHSAR